MHADTSSAGAAMSFSGTAQIKSCARRLVLVLLLSCSAFAAHAQGVISHVYGGGGNTDAPFNRDFIELHNNGTTPADMSGWSVQYASNDGDPLSTLSIADLTIHEGDSGTRTVTFTVQLSSPATAGGVTFDIATDNDTATEADTDYTSNMLAGQAIPAGSSIYTFDVAVNGDVDVEPNESFLVNVTNVSGATIGDGQARATILSDDFNITPIHVIQGLGARSPYEGNTITAIGVVTGRKANGFFIQSVIGDEDTDNATSEGIFVFTGTTPPAQAMAGNHVRVSGTVVEFIPAADPGQLPFTEINNATVVELSADNSLPAPVQLTPLFPDAANPALDQLERVESMRVTAQSFTVVAPTRGSTDEDDATASSNGQFNLVVTDVARPLREPGIPNPDLAPGGGSIPPIPRWDFNPELLLSDSDGIGAPSLDLAAGATLTNYVGPMDYRFRRYSIYPDPAITATIVQPAPTAARLPTADEFTVATYNLERFFDTINDPGSDDPVLTPTAYANRLNKASLGIRNFLNAPDILGVVEVEKLSVLQGLSNKISADAIAAGQPDPQYVAYLQEGNDVSGIDVGFLVKSAEVAAGIDRVQVGNMTQLGKAATVTNPDGSITPLHDRPPLALDFVVHFAGNRRYPITVMVVHQLSLDGADANDANGARVRNRRQKQAEYLAIVLQSMQNDPDRHIALVGDFNAFEFNDGLVDAMNVISGTPAPDNATAVPGDGVDLVNKDLLNLAWDESPGQRYSFVGDGNAQSLDHVLINQELGASVGAFSLDHARINADFPETHRNDAQSASRLSDHDPLVAYFAVTNADLAVTLTATPASVAVGDTITFNSTVTNLGPDAANFPAIGVIFGAALPDLVVTTPPGWTCETPTFESGSTWFGCASMTALANAASAAFQFTATAPASAQGGSFHSWVVAHSQTEDPDVGNSERGAGVAVVEGFVDLSVRLNTLARWYRPSDRIDFQIPVYSSGPDAASLAVLDIAANIPANAIVNVGAPQGWFCHQPAGSTYLRQCYRPAAMGTSSVEYFNVSIFLPASFSSTYLTVTTQVSSAGTELTPANNAAVRNIPRR